MIAHPLLSAPSGIPGHAMAGFIHGTDRLTYRCFLPDLTRFMRVCHMEAGRDVPWIRAKCPKEGIQPRVSGFREKGTANSPPSAISS